MAELGVIAIVFVCVSAVIWVLTKAYNQRVARSAAPPKRWTLEEHSDGELTCVYCECPGEQPLLVGAVPWASQNFESEIEDVRAKGRYRLTALNSGLELRN